jgi:glycosyltransferase involved in cell wall biosynthesis
MKFLLGSVPHNLHIQNIGRSLHEAGWLESFRTSGADHFKGRPGRALRRAMERAGMGGKMARRRIEGIPEDLIETEWFWESLRLAASRLKLGIRAEDWVWEKGERSFDGRCAALMRSDRYDAFFGVEHGCEATLAACRAAGKRSVVAFSSPHHSFRKRWVDAEYEKFPELATEDLRALSLLGRKRDALRDREAAAADFIHANSALTARSLVEAGFSSEKIITVPLGAPSALAGPPAPLGPGPLRFMYAGNVSVQKGAHYLLEAWKKAARPGAELHLYGRIQLPAAYVRRFDSGVFFHGPVTAAELGPAYARAAFLVFPTLCDGFGMVVLEAMAQGVPVITTPNAGAHGFIRPGENGFLVPPADTEALADTLSRCIAEGDSRPERRTAAWETARRWTWADFRAALGEKLAGVSG